MFKLAKAAFAATLATVVVASQSFAADPIRIPLHNWTSQLVGAEIVGRILQKGGSEVEYVPADSGAVYEAMCEGDIDLVHEVWQGAFGVAFEKQVGKGCVIDAATHDAKTREEWWYPAYVEDVCPGLPDWKALNGCAKIFATVETQPKGRFLGGPAEWLKGDDERVHGLEMDFAVINAGSADALWAELAIAKEKNQPIVLFNWTPNFIEALYDGKFIEFPEYFEGCREDASLGINPNTTHDCGNPKGGYLKIGVWKGLPEKDPNAYAILQKINFTNLDVAVMSKLVDVDKMEVQDAATKWMSDNEFKWKSWLIVAFIEQLD